MTGDPAKGGYRGARVQIALATVLFAVGVGLLALGVWVELPGPLVAYSDPTASWPVHVQVLLAATAFLGWRWVNRRNTRAFTAVLLTAGLVCVLVLGTASYARCPQDGQSPFWSVTNRVLGLVLNTYSTEDFAQPSCELGAAPLALQAAHLAQLFVLLVAATSAVVLLLRGQFDRLVVRFSRRVHLALGADASGAAVLPALTAGAGPGTRAVVTQDPSAPWLAPARLDGWRIVAGDPSDPAVLRTLLRRPNGRHALRGLAVLSAASVDAQRLMHSVGEAVGDLRGESVVRAVLRIDDAWQAEDWRRRYLGQSRQWVVDTISEYEVTARLLASDVRDRGVETLVLAGRSGLTFALLAEVAQQRREAELVGGAALPSLVLVDPLAGKVWDEHLLAQQGFGMSIQEPCTVRDEQDVETVLDELMQADAGRLGLVFTGDVSAEDQRLASRLGVLHPALVIWSRRSEVSGLGAWPLLAQVVAFGTTLDPGEGRLVDRWERLARLAHEAYVSAHPDPGNPARLPWDGGLSEFHRDSNVRLIITTLGAAVAAGRSWASSTGTPPDHQQPSAEQLELMAEIEHESWCQHLTEHGRSHVDLVPWGRLGEPSRAKTRDGVLEALELLATLGYRSFDDPDAGWRRFRRTGEVVAVRREEDWEWTTSGGAPMRARAGDWEVTDTQGTTRSVSATSFPGTHEHVDGDRYRRVGMVEARRAVPGEVVVSPEGSATAGPGQWLLRNPASDESWLVPDPHFRATYEVDDA